MMSGRPDEEQEKVDVAVCERLNLPLRFAKFKSDVCLQMEDYQGPKRKANYSTVAS